MPSLVLPHLQTTLDPSPSPLALSYLSQAWLLATWISLVLVTWDWLVHLGEEKRYVWTMWTSHKGHLGGGRTRCERWTVPGKRWKVGCFAVCRYLTLAVVVWAVAIFTLGRYFSSSCSAARVLPFGFSLAVCTTHLVLSYRIFCIFDQSLVAFYSILAMSVIDVGLQLATDVLVQPVFLTYALSFDGSTSPPLHVCYITSTTPVLAITFLSPAVVGHVVLFLTLFASWRHWATEKALADSGVKTPSLMASLRMHHTGLVLAICLTNFVNVVLVLQTAARAYQLIHFLPSLVLTHLLLTRLFFSLERRLTPCSSSFAPSPRFSLPPIVITPTGSPPPGTVRRLSRADRLSQRLEQASLDFSFVPMRTGEKLEEGARESSPPSTTMEQRLSRQSGMKRASSPPPLMLESASSHSRSVQEVLLIQSSSFPQDNDLELPTATTTATLVGGGENPSPTSPSSSVVPLFHLSTREIVRQASLSGTAEARSPVLPISMAREREREERAGPSHGGGAFSSFSAPSEREQLSAVVFPSLPSPPPASTPASTAPVKPNPPLPFLPLRASSSSSSSHLPPSQPAARSGHGYAADASSPPTPPRPSLTQTNSSSSFSTSASHHHLPHPPFPSSPSLPSEATPASQAFYLHHPSRARVFSAQSASQVEGYLSRSGSTRITPSPSHSAPQREEKGGGEEAKPPLERTGGSGYESTVDPMMHGGERRRRAESSVLEREGA